MMVKFNFSLKFWLGVFLLYSVGCITIGDNPRAGLNEEDKRTCDYLLHPNGKTDEATWCNWDDGCHIANTDRAINNGRGKCKEDPVTGFGKCVYENKPEGTVCDSNYKNQKGTCDADGVCVPDGIDSAESDTVNVPDADSSATDTTEHAREFLQECNKILQDSGVDNDLICTKVSVAGQSGSRRRGLTEAQKGINIVVKGGKLDTFKKVLSGNNNKIGKYSTEGISLATTGSTPGTPAGTPAGSSGIQSNSIISAFVFTLAMM